MCRKETGIPKCESGDWSDSKRQELDSSFLRAYFDLVGFSCADDSSSSSVFVFVSSDEEEGRGSWGPDEAAGGDSLGLMRPLPLPAAGFVPCFL
jgi:hypothetical protein